jgi:hypothetical protein
LLPTAQFTEYTDWLRKRQAEFTRALDSFVADYPALRAQASMKLGGLYRPEDYPDVADIRAKFSVGLNYMPVPADGDIRVNLAADQVAMIESSIADNRASSVDTAMRDAWERLHTVVARVVERLSDPSAIFRDSLIENTSEICDVLKRLNIAGDPNLESMRVAVQQQIASMQPETLRINKHVRQDTADKAKQILDKMAAFYSAA